ncbi:hypothetical protein DPMN_005228 [Dreissena polymorpha]|uniref:Uncharacterized protein n=1 Tax=Dreissena polymorpha TaxID=45954 RepID=A0A9D4FQY5_DREPO|nr:hypothetical protein DPMN_131608 [Dreissena polymorpha]KAH3881303.1 hypothetical protein DPMN_005228 [Dreissena polymorpha]
MVGSTIGPSCLTLFSLLPPFLPSQWPDGWFNHRSVLSYNLLPASAFSAFPSGPDGWFYHRSVLSYTLLPVSAFSPSQVCQMVGSTIGPSSLPLSSLFLPSLLPSGPDGWFYHRSVLSYTLLPASAFSPPSGPDGWFYHRSVLSYTLLPVSAFFPSQAGQMVGSTIGPRVPSGLSKVVATYFRQI